MNPAASVGARGTFKLFALGFGGVLFFIIFLHAITESVQQRNIQPLLQEVGDRLILASKGLSQESKAIVAQGSVFSSPGSGSRWSAVWGTILTLSGLIGALLVVFGWLKVLSWFWSKTPYSVNAFAHYSLAVLSFWLLQFIALIVNASIAKLPIGFTGENSVTAFFVQPLTAFWDFLKAVPYILSPAGKVVDKIEKATG